ncbi:MAG TPA: hypothetical protein EYG92_00625 [Lutibacter sp.]|nr:hypothetical protein [Lutibacter sp.]
MTKVFISYLVIFLGFTSLYSQNNIPLFDFANAPQTLLLNPAYDIEAQYHVTIPFFGGNKISIESSGITAYDLFANNSTPFQDKVQNTIYQLTDKDFLLTNQKMELIHIGQRIRKDLYISYGLYEELDLFMSFPVELLKLPFEGTSFSGKNYNIDGFNLQANLMSVYHVGVQRKYSKQLSLGARLKFYNSAFDFSVGSIKGSFKTDINNDNTVTHSLNDFDLAIKSAGLPIKIDSDLKIIRDSNNNILLNDNGTDVTITDFISRGNILTNTLFSGNKGVGFDLGATYKIKKITLAASINDLGFIYNYKLAQTYSYKGDYVKESLAFEYDSSDPISYVDRLVKDITDTNPVNIQDKGYISFRPFQINLFATYAFGGIRNNQCQYLKSAYSYKPIDKIGAHIYTQYRPNNILYEASIFYERKITNGLLTRINYTVNRYSASNLGLAVSGQVGKLNLYAGFNNILALSNLAKANSISAQVGINVLLPNKR